MLIKSAPHVGGALSISAFYIFNARNNWKLQITKILLSTLFSTSKNPTDGKTDHLSNKVHLRT